MSLRVASLADTEGEKFLGLFAFQPVQFLNRETWQGNGAGAISLWRLEPLPSVGLLQALDNAGNARSATAGPLSSQ